jgi:type IX secretion system PorP/SprF family membrane protein
MRGTVLCLLLTIAGITPSMSQDLHFTQNNFAPIYFNPAETGAFLGTYRISGLYRDQNRSFFGTAFQTPILNIDSPFMFGFKPNHWIGGGITVFQDKAGEHSYSSTGFLGSLAYHIGLDKKLQRVITLGVKYGFIGLRINETEGKFADEIAGGILLSGIPTSDDRQLLQDFSGGYSNLSAGFLFKSPIGDKSSIELGAAAHHIIPSDFDFPMSNARNEINLRANVQSRINLQVNDRFSLSPTFYFSNLSTSNNIVLQLNTAIQINKTKTKRQNQSINPFMLYPGIGYRLGDAAQLILGGEIKGYRVSLAYDFALGDYSEFTRNGALELGFQYIIRIDKKPEIKPIIFCPRI